MYGTEFDGTRGLFGLRCGQIRGGEIAHNGGWYNHRGEKLGWGDLAAVDFGRISRELMPDELFIVLGEQNSFWEFVEKIGAIGSQCTTTPTIEAPGVEYVTERAMYIISPGKCYYVDRCGSRKEDLVYGGVTFGVLSPETAGALITAVASL